MIERWLNIKIGQFFVNAYWLIPRSTPSYESINLATTPSILSETKSTGKLIG